jgi:hypothetical protein
VLLEEGAWTLAESRRARATTHRLQDELRELLLSYRPHRLLTYRGWSGTRVYGIGALRFLLESAPGEAVCDACLAFACGTSLAEMRELTEGLLRAEPLTFQRASSCASCRRTVPTIVCK